jgi:hypothetical protein
MPNDKGLIDLVFFGVNYYGGTSEAGETGCETCA